MYFQQPRAWFALFFAFLTGLVLVLPSCALADPVHDLSIQGDNAYREGDFQKAIDLYSKVISGGYESGSLYYNLGSAWFKSGKLAPAILYFERAARLMPHDKDVRFNLEFAKSRTVDRIENPPRLPIWNWIDSLRDAVSPAFAARFSFISLTVAATLFAVLIFLRNPLLKRTLGWSSAIVTAFGLILLLLVGLRFVADHGPDEAIIMVEKVVVHSAPDETSSDLFHLHEGTKVAVIKRIEGFVEIRLADGRQGWMPADICEVI